MELSVHRIQSEIDSSFQPISHIIPQNLLSNFHFIEESELEEESEEQLSFQRIQINQEDKAKNIQELKTSFNGILFKTNSRMLKLIWASGLSRD